MYFNHYRPVVHGTLQWLPGLRPYPMKGTSALVGRAGMPQFLPRLRPYPMKGPPATVVHSAICPSGQPAVHPLPMLCLPVSLSVCLLVSVSVHLCVV